MNHCPIILDLLPLYVENMVSPETTEFIRNHLSTCPQCRQKWEQINFATPKDTVPHEEWKKALKKERRKNLFRNTTLWILTALLILSLIAGYGIYRYYESHYGETPHVEIVMDPQDMLSICPKVVPTAVELSLMDERFLLSSLPTEYAVLSPEVYLPFTDRLVPLNATIGEISGSRTQLTVDYFYGEDRIMLVYTDHDLDGALDELQKYVSYRYREIDDPFYSSLYDPTTRTTVYILHTV